MDVTRSDSMGIKDIAQFQKEFDKRHGWIDDFSSYDEGFFERLQYATISLAGEAGEFSNFLKKILRERKLTGRVDESLMAGMKEELVDTFIYLIILSIILKVDLGSAYHEKMKFNKQKYKRFENK